MLLVTYLVYDLVSGDCAAVSCNFAQMLDVSSTRMRHHFVKRPSL